MKCKHCSKKISFFWGILYPFCDYVCGGDFQEAEKEKEKLDLENEIKELKEYYSVKEEVSDKIKIKRIKTDYLPEYEYILLDIVTSWKNAQDPSLKIIDVKTWSIDADDPRDREGCQAKIIYTFDVKQENLNESK